MKKLLYISPLFLFASCRAVQAVLGAPITPSDPASSSIGDALPGLAGDAATVFTGGNVAIGATVTAVVGIAVRMVMKRGKKAA